jgi:hypothetical protein
MTSPRQFLALASLATLVCAATPAFAQHGAWFRGGSGGGRMEGSRGSYGGGYRGSSWGDSRGFSYGASVRVGGLPRGYATYSYRGADWYFGAGRWYRPWRGGYMAFYPPIGLCLPLLPLGYMTYYYGGMPYYYYEDVYYTSAPTGGYMVADPPPEAEAPRRPSQPAPRPADAAALDALLIIPKAGQSEEKMLADRKEAQRYAMEESRYDPGRSDASDPGTPRARQAYLRAMRSYLETRGYSVK